MKNREITIKWLKGEYDQTEEYFPEEKKFRVFLRTKPGFQQSYDGYVDCLAKNEEEAPREAVKKLRRTSFPDRGFNDWIIEGVEKNIKLL